MIRSLLIITFLVGIGWMCHGQTSFDQIRYDAIPFKKVRSYLQDQQYLSEAEFLADLQPSCIQEDDLSSFYVYEKKYKVKSSMGKVWQTYRNASPTEAWTNRKSACALLYEREFDALIYPDEAARGITPGQILFMDLKLLKGFYHMATSFEITRVEDELGVIQFNYTRSGVSKGKQIIKMEETENGETIITHTSIIRSGNRIRDRVLYPYFHNKLINAFHRNMRRWVETEALLADQ